MRLLVAVAAGSVLSLLAACSAADDVPRQASKADHPSVTATGQAQGCRCVDTRTCRCSEFWDGKITIALPARLTSTNARSRASCGGRAGSRWADVHPHAPVVMRSGGGRVLATWKLPVGARSHRKAHGGECRYTLTQQHGIDASFKIYSLRIGSHVLAVPADHIDGNLVITLPNTLSNKLIKLNRNL